MPFLDLREPASTLTHALGAAMALPATWWLWRRASAGGFTRQLALAVYGLSLAGCLGASAAYHAAPMSAESVASLRRIDHIGIHLLIAGTYTPIALTLLRGWLRAATLGIAWGIAAVGSTILLIWGILPPWLFTAVYLGAGWGACFAYFEIARTQTHRVSRPIWMGGVAYSIGALLNVAEWPVLSPGAFEAHDVFHLFVLAGAALHFQFMAQVVAPHQAEPRPALLDGRADGPQPARPRMIREVPGPEVSPSAPTSTSQHPAPAGPLSAPGRR